MISDAELKEYWESFREKKRLEEQGIQLSQVDQSYEGFTSFIKPARTLTELVDLIDKFDPYNYKVVYVYEKSIYIGIKVFVQFQKNGPVLEVPKERFETIYVRRSFVRRIKTYFTIFREKNRKKRYDDGRSIQG